MKNLINDPGVTLADMKIQWHPAFCAAAELELRENKDALDFYREYNLSKKPLQMDLLVVEMLDDVIIKNEIGHIFRKYNVIEYKSPGDELSIDDFFKTLAYAYLYKSQGKTVDQIPLDELTVSLVREGKPEELFRSLEKYGFKIEEKFSGIYYVKGLQIPVQIIVTKELDPDKHRSLRVLSRNALEEDARAFVENSYGYTDQGDLLNVDAILQASVSANYDLYKELRGRYPAMCEALRMLMKDEIQEAVQEAQKAGEARGEARGELKAKKETAFELYNRKLSIEVIADIIKVNLETVKSWFAEMPKATR